MKNKFITTIFSLILIVFTFTSSVFANATYEDEEYFYYPEGVVPSNMTSDAGKYNCDKVLLKINDIYYMMFFCSSTYSHGTNKLYITSNGRIAGSKIADGELITVRKYNFDTQKWSYYSYGGGNYYEYSSNGVTSLLANYEIISSSTDVYTDNTYSTIFFQKPPQVVEEEQTLTLRQIMEKEQQEKKTIQEIVGLLPLILVVVVSFLGLRKALKMLLTLLRRCLVL